MRENDYIRAIGEIKLTEEQTFRVRQGIVSRFETGGMLKRIPLRAICAGGLVIAILSGIIFASPLIFKKDDSGQPGDNTTDKGSETVDTTSKDSSDTTDNPGTIIPDDYTVPEWYEPGELILKTISKKTISPVSAPAGGLKVKYLSADTAKIETSRSESTEIELPAGFEVSGSHNATLLEVTAESGEHKDCAGLFYDTETGETICLTHTLKKILQESSNKYRLFELRFYKPDLSAAIFFLYGNIREDYKCVLLDVEKNTVRYLPVDFLDVTTTGVSPDFRYFYFCSSEYSTTPWNLYSIDLTSPDINKVKIYRKDGNPYSLALKGYYSPKGKLLYTVVLDENGTDINGLNVQWLIFNTETQTSFVFRGNVLRFADDEQIVVAETSGGIKLYDTSTGEEIGDIGRLEFYEQYKVDITSKSLITGGIAYTVNLVPYLDSTKESISVAEKVSGYLVEDEYLYTYTDGDEYILVFSLNTFQSFRLKINENFLNEINTARQSYAIDYRLDINTSKTRILLYYYTKEKNQVRVDYSRIIWDEFKDADCLDDLYEIIKAGYDDNSGTYATKLHAQMYKGNGFNSLVMYKFPYAFAIVEDYRDRTFTMYDLGVSYAGGKSYILGMFDVSRMPEMGKGVYPQAQYDKYRKKLNPDANSDKTLKKFDYIEVKNAVIDYAEFYNGDKLDLDKAWNYFNSPDYIIKYISDGSIKDKKNQKESQFGSGKSQLLRSLLEIASAQDLKVFPEFERNKLFSDSDMSSSTADYSITCSTYARLFIEPSMYYVFTVGVSTDGRKYLKHNGKYAFIDDQTYDQVIQICAKMY